MNNSLIGEFPENKQVYLQYWMFKRKQTSPHSMKELNDLPLPINIDWDNPSCFYLG